MPDLHGFGHMLVEGTWVTIQVSVLSTIFGIVIGIVFALMKLSPSRIAQQLGEAFTTVVRGTPALLLILLVYFGGTVLVNQAAQALGHTGHIDMNPFAAGLLALSVAFGAYATEVFRGAFLAIAPGQIEAARAIGMSRALSFWRIALPQVWRLALPALGNVYLVILKETALVSVIGLEDLMRKTDYAVSFTKKPFTFYLSAAFIYLGLTIISMVLLHLMERRAARGHSSRGLA